MWQCMANRLQTEGVAVGDDDALLSAPEMDDLGVSAGQKGGCERSVVHATLVQQVNGRAVCSPLPHSAQAAEASSSFDRFDAVTAPFQQDVERRVVTACQSERAMDCEKREGVAGAVLRDTGLSSISHVHDCFGRKTPIGAGNRARRHTLCGSERANARKLATSSKIAARHPPSDPVADLDVARHSLNVRSEHEIGHDVPN